MATNELLIRITGGIAFAGSLLTATLRGSESGEFWLWTGFGIILAMIYVFIAKPATKGHEWAKWTQVFLTIPLIVLVFIAPAWYLFLAAAILSVFVSLRLFRTSDSTKGTASVLSN